MVSHRPLMSSYVISKKILIFNVLNRIALYLIFSNNLSVLIRIAKILLLVTAKTLVISVVSKFSLSGNYLISFSTEVLNILLDLTLRS